LFPTHRPGAGSHDPGRFPSEGETSRGAEFETGGTHKDGSDPRFSAIHRPRPFRRSPHRIQTPPHSVHVFRGWCMARAMQPPCYPLNHRGQRLGVSEGAPHPPPSRPAVAAWRAMVPDPVQYLIADVNNHTHARTRRTHPRPRRSFPLPLRYGASGVRVHGDQRLLRRAAPRGRRRPTPRGRPRPRGMRTGGAIPLSAWVRRHVTAELSK